MRLWHNCNTLLVLVVDDFRTNFYIMKAVVRLICTYYCNELSCNVNLPLIGYHDGLKNAFRFFIYILSAIIMVRIANLLFPVN